MIDRTTIIRGPAVLKLGAIVLYTEDDITVAAEITTTEGKNAIVGKYDEFMDTIIHTISFKPASQARSDYFTALLPYTNPALGAMLYGAAPPDLIVWSVDGTQYTYKQVALTQMPSLSFSPSTPLFDGEAVFTAIGEASAAWNSVDQFVAVDTVAFADTSFNPAVDIRQPYSAAWGNQAPFSTLKTESGFKVSFDLQTEDVMEDGYGLVDKSISGLSATATFTPLGISPEEVLIALGIVGATVARGRSMVSGGRDLVLTSDEIGGPVFSLFNGIMKGSTTQFGASVNRMGELSITSLRSMTGGALNPVFSIGS